MTRTPHAGGVFSRTVLSTAGMAVQGLTRFIYTLAIGRLAGPDALGETSALLSIAVYMSLVLPAGLGTAASRYLPTPTLANAAAHLLPRWFWASSSLLAIIAAPIAYWITHNLLAAASCAILVFTYNAYVYTRGVLMGEDRIFRATVADFVSSLVAITALVAVLIAGAHWALLLPLAVGYAIFALASRPRTVPGLASTHDRVAIRRFLRDATIGALATGGLLPATMIFVRAYDSPVQAGLFAAALSLATPASLVSQAVNQVLIPHFARLQSSPLVMQASHRRLFAATFALFIVVFGALAALAPFILSVLYGERYAGGTAAMQALLAIVFLISTTCAPSAYLVASGRQRIFAQIWLIFFLAGTATMFFASPALGMWGALLGFAIGGGGGSLVVILVGLLSRANNFETAHTLDSQEKPS
jgi:O-antigen/teichoic acid export membrane protein